ncbi:MAG: hypothetical protein N2663_03640 [Chlorobi bacterium]|nr:hypothetical protein [Chlorobiota bacterium]
MATLFGLLYLLFGIVGFSRNSATRADQWMPFILASIHLCLAAVLFWTSSRERRIEHGRLERLLRMALQTHPSLSAREFAELAGISYSEAQEFLLWISRSRQLVTVANNGSTLWVWSRHSLN